MKICDKNSLYLFFISGPTASGKTDLSLKIAKELRDTIGLNSQIINADVGQFYYELSVGTAKPDWRNMPVKHHLFDVLNSPNELNVFSYRKMVIDVARQVAKEGDLPIIVGGSLFYLQSIFFPPLQSLQSIGCESDSEQRDGRLVETKLSEKERKDFWRKLNEIDPDRAKEIHPNDTYRLVRALDIWEKTGKKPSDYEPNFDPPCHARISFIDLCRETLFDRINRRTSQMVLESGWIDEAKKLKGSAWETFLQVKKLIGYPEIFSWIEEGENEEAVDDLVKEIQKKTRHYGKRQITFWKKFQNLLLYYGRTSPLICRAETIHSAGEADAKKMCVKIVQDLEQIKTKQRGER